MAFGLKRLFGHGVETTAAITRPRLQVPEWPAAVYAIGDVHGCLAQLRLLHQKILADAANIEGTKLIVSLGDYVDRGVDSAGVLDFLLSGVPEGFSRVCLAGNHEVMMLDHIAEPRSADRWLDFGGLETLISYGIDTSAYMAAGVRERKGLLQSHIPPQHLDFLRKLPVVLSFPGLVLVHAGLRAGVPLEDQEEDDLLWIRGQDGDEQQGATDGPLLVHGHTPTQSPRITGRTINIDTGAFATGILTAVRLRPGEKPFFLNVGVSDRT
ncbi:metallophosphoesterase family protein [Devosia sp.]|uniref:metallophosphoesterase family protein n=1 Tax=Devosia sp. TaxID=1871048 RepID=UPI00292E40DE|nr:metallophosphoesterase family protein [Devosia sp.]